MTRLTQQAANGNGTKAASEGTTQKLVGLFQAELTKRLGADASFAKRERAGLELANQLCRTDQRRELERRSELYDCSAVAIDGQRHRRRGRSERSYHGLCGPLRVMVSSYRRMGVHNGATVVPLELHAGLIHGATPGLGFAVAQGYAQDTSRALDKSMRSAHRQLPSRSTLERLAKRLGEATEQQLPRIEPLIRAAEVVPAGATAIAVGLDRSSAPMREPVESSNRKTVKRQKPYQRTPPEPFTVHYRMAYVGTVSFVDQDSQVIITRKYAAGAHTEPAELVDRMMADLRTARSQMPSLPLVVLQDGAPEMWNLVNQGLELLLGLGPAAAVHRAIDRHHLLERLHDALRLTGHTDAYRLDKVAEWNQQLDEDDGAIDLIEQQVIALYQGHHGEVRKKLYAHCVYIENNKHLMRYASLRRCGLPVGSGPTEGACKCLLQRRVKGSGQHWLTQGIDAVLSLRSLDQSERLLPAFDELASSYTANITRLAA